MNPSPKTPILFIDDDVFFATGYLDELDKSYQVTIARDAVAAEVELQNPGQFLCVVLDVMMPVPEAWPAGDKVDAKDGEHTGIILLRRCKKLVFDAKLPVIVLSNRDLKEMKTEVEKIKLPQRLVEVYRKTVTPAFMLPKIVRDIIHRVKKVNT